MENLSEALSKSIIKKLEKHHTYYIGMPYTIYDAGPHYINTKYDIDGEVFIEIFNEEEKDDAIKKKYKGAIYKILFKYINYNDLKKKIEKDIDLYNIDKSKIELIYDSDFN